MLLLVGVMLVLLALGVPVAFAIGIASAAYILIAGEGLRPVVLAQMTVSGADSFILLAVPFFIFAGELMNAGGITRRLIAFAEALVGSLRGGLAYVVVIVNMIMAGVSGAAIADAAAVGSVMIPSMIKGRLPARFRRCRECVGGHDRPGDPAQRRLHHLCIAGERFRRAALPGRRFPG